MTSGTETSGTGTSGTGTSGTGTSGTDQAAPDVEQPGRATSGPAAKAASPGGARRGPGPLRSVTSFGRNLWRRLTSMRTALVLLFLLALASLPGALLPQWSLNASKTAQYILDHPTIGPLMERAGLFEVFAAPWYAAIYLLLFTSLVGCVLPRSWEFVGQLRAAPVATPRNLGRLPHHDRRVVAGDPGQVADTIEHGLTGRRGRRWRIARRSEQRPGGTTLTISAERGYLREVGNLVFHLSLLGLLVAVAVGKLFGWEGSVIVNAGQGFCSMSPANYDNFRPGLTVDGTELNPFCVTVDSFDADYTPIGQAISFRADVRYSDAAALAAAAGGAEPATRSAVLQVNDPLRLDGERVYLLGHGYSPEFTVTFPGGETRVYTQPFVPSPNDPNFTSEGAVKILDPPGWTGDEVREHQLAIVGIFAPTAVEHGGIMSSAYPDAVKPGVAVDIYRGDVGLDTGASQSVFAVDQQQIDSGALVKQERVNLYKGDSVTLDDGTVIAFTGVTEWVSLQTSYDPAQGWALVFAVLLLAGLMVSLLVKRRRVWFRLAPTAPDGPQGRTLVQVGGLARTDQAGYGSEFDALVGLAGPAIADRPSPADPAAHVGPAPAGTVPSTTEPTAARKGT